MFHNRVSAFFSSNRFALRTSVATCQGAFVAVPTPMLNSCSQNDAGYLQQVYQTAYDAAVRQMIRRSVIESWSPRFN